MVGLEILVRIHPEKRAEFLQAFDMLTTLDQQDEQRVDLDLFEQVKKPNTFLWVEHWDTDESLANYYQHNKYRAMLGAIEILGQLIHKRSFSVREEKKDA